MKLKQILEIHQKHRPKNALKGNFGDGYLLSTNRVYQNIRSSALRFGYRFKEGRFHDYDALALTQLPLILKKKVIPYCDNVRCLQEIEKSAAGHFDWNDLPVLRANYVFHESAHGVARSLRLKKVPHAPLPLVRSHKKAKLSLKVEQSIVLGLLLEESFANACECFSNAEIKGEIDEAFFLKNSYVVEKEAIRERLRSAVRSFGEESIFKLVFISFLHANFTKTNELTRVDFYRVLDLVFLKEGKKAHQFTQKQRKILEEVFWVGLELDQAFTLFTNAFCLRIMGIHHDLFEVLAFDFLKNFEKDGIYEKLLISMAETACRG